MKTIRFFGMVLMTVLLSVNFAACGDDDDENGNTQNSKYEKSDTLLINSYTALTIYKDSKFSYVLGLNSTGRTLRITPYKYESGAWEAVNESDAEINGKWICGLLCYDKKSSSRPNTNSNLYTGSFDDFSIKIDDTDTHNWEGKYTPWVGQIYAIYVLGDDDQYHYIKTYCCDFGANTEKGLFVSCKYYKIVYQQY